LNSAQDLSEVCFAASFRNLNSSGVEACGAARATTVLSFGELDDSLPSATPEVEDLGIAAPVSSAQLRWAKDMKIGFEKKVSGP